MQSGFPGTDGGAQIVVQFRWHQSCISMLCCFMCIVAIVVSMNRYPDSPTIFLVVRPMFVSNSVSNTKTWKERPKVGEDESQRGREGESVRESDGRGRGMVEESDRDRTRCQTEHHKFNENKDKLGWRKKAKSLKDTTTNSRRTITSWGGERKPQYTTTSITSRST